MEECLVEREEAFMADEEAPVVAQVCEGALDLPASAVAAQRSSILQLDFAAATMRRDQFDASCGEPLPQP